jgi:hypothetical protein
MPEYPMAVWDDDGAPDPDPETDPEKALPPPEQIRSQDPDADA